MNINMTGFRWFSKIFASLCFGLISALSIGRLCQSAVHMYFRITTSATCLNKSHIRVYPKNISGYAGTYILIDLYHQEMSMFIHHSLFTIALCFNCTLPYVYFVQENYCQRMNLISTKYHQIDQTLIIQNASSNSH